MSTADRAAGERSHDTACDGAGEGEGEPGPLGVDWLPHPTWPLGSSFNHVLCQTPYPEMWRFNTTKVCFLFTCGAQGVRINKDILIRQDILGTWRSPPRSQREA